MKKIYCTECGKSDCPIRWAYPIMTAILFGMLVAELVSCHG